jgi:hypothetical protein
MDLPDFSKWTTERLKFLLSEYRGRRPQNRQDALLFDRWIHALDFELAKRQAR